MKKRTRIILAIAIAVITFGTLHATVGSANTHSCNRDAHSCRSNAQENEEAHHSVPE